ncbi:MULTISPECIES: DMT family transporter [unclassified Anabaena]|uniref:DMT family transporter n=1 Tax=unclassified Anabaena TaxID=2619674 RepID=UPI001688608C|nr:multidrug efflux SMR transporter [Anabaena sp. UHCC 0399]MBD2360921.1 multidrug efflux SMR transporter [Anabaena minutissima FACHB-250]MEA5566265.1 multidrug efflux SMR transporter [Anabaena sp. UHCC 0399]
MLINWVYLLAAILFEVLGTTCMKLSEGFKNIIPSILIFVFYGFGFTFSTLSLEKIDVGVAYAIWSGLGTMLIASIGIIWFQESMSLVKFLSIGLIVIGVIGINASK